MAIIEKLKENYVPRTLFVGLGGTGSAVVQMLASKCRGSETDNVSFVVLDTNVNDLEKVTGLDLFPLLPDFQYAVRGRLPEL